MGLKFGARQETQEESTGKYFVKHCGAAEIIL
jgi:hypothetical protein